MRLRRVALVVLSAGGALAAPAEERLAVTKDGLRPGWLIVGVTGSSPVTVPIKVELRLGSEGSPPKVSRAEEARRFNLCGALRAAGWAEAPGTVFLTVRRGEAVYRGRIGYDGKLCRAVASEGALPASPNVEPTVTARMFEPPPVFGVQEAEPSPGPTPQVVAAVAPTPVQAPPREVPTAALRPVPTPAAPTATAAPTRTPVAPTPTTAPPAAAQSDLAFGEAAAPSGPSAGERNLTAENFTGIRVWIYKDAATRTEEYRFNLVFRRPVNIEGIDELVIEDATAVVGKRERLFEPGTPATLDVPVDSKATLEVGFTVSKGLVIASREPGVNHLVKLRVRLLEVSFEGETGVKRLK